MSTVRARVEAAPNFLANLAAAREFLVDQDPESAPARFRQLQADLRESLRILAWSPASGRPARFLAGRSAQMQLRAAALRQLAVQAGLPGLRESVVGNYLVLYAHSDTEVVLLALKHQRQLSYRAGD